MVIILSGQSFDRDLDQIPGRVAPGPAAIGLHLLASERRTANFQLEARAIPGKDMKRSTD